MAEAEEVINEMRLYESPNRSWLGVCEVSADGQKYRHLASWPHITHDAIWLTFLAGQPLEYLIAKGHWRQSVSSQLAVCEGL